MVKFRVKQGDIFEGDADGIVNSIGQNLELGGGVCRTL
jgi:O-acetyl-ADP-ribose deacetylase (regulator of RNase III)